MRKFLKAFLWKAFFIFHGSASGPAATPNRILEPNIAGIHFGTSVSGNAKFNNDNFSDIAIGAPHYSVTHFNQVVVYIYLGSSVGISITSSWQAEANSASAQFGQSIAGDFDMNGDGYDDLVVGAPVYKINTTGDGAVFSYYGSAN